MYIRYSQSGPALLAKILAPFAGKFFLICIFSSPDKMKLKAIHNIKTRNKSQLLYLPTSRKRQVALRLYIQQAYGSGDQEAGMRSARLISPFIELHLL